MRHHRDLAAAAVGTATWLAFPSSSLALASACFALGMAWSRLTRADPPELSTAEARWQNAKDALFRRTLWWLGVATVGAVAIAAAVPLMFDLNQWWIEQGFWAVMLDPVGAVMVAAAILTVLWFLHVIRRSTPSLGELRRQVVREAARMARATVRGEVADTRRVEVLLELPELSGGPAERRIRWGDAASASVLRQLRSAGVQGDEMRIAFSHHDRGLPELLRTVEGLRSLLADRWRSRGEAPLASLVGAYARDLSELDRDDLLEGLKREGQLSEEVAAAWLSSVPGPTSTKAAEALEDSGSAWSHRASNPTLDARDRVHAGLMAGGDPTPWWNVGDHALAAYLSGPGGHRDVGEALVAYLRTHPAPPWRAEAVALLVHTGIVWQGEGSAAAESLLDDLQREGLVSEAAALRGLEEVGGTVGVKLGLVYDTLIERAAEAGGLSVAEVAPVGGISEAAVKAGALTRA